MRRSKDKAVSRINWTTKEWLQVLAVAHDDIVKGVDIAKATFLAQKVVILDKARQKTREQMKHQSYPSSAGGKTWVQVQGMNAAQRATLFDGPAVPPPPQPEPEPVEAATPTEPGTRVVWTEREILLLMRRVRDWRERMRDTRSIAGLLYAAQQLELPEDRRRKRSVLSTDARRMEQRFIEAKAGFWKINQIPFVADALDYDAAHPRPAPAPPAPEPSTGPAIEFAATQAPPAPPEGLQGAFAAFADHLLAGMGPLLAAHEAHVLAKVNDTLATQGADMVREIAALVAERVDQMLGGKPKQPEPEAPPAPLALASTNGITEPQPALPKIKIDVVGSSHGSTWEADIGKAFMNDNLDIRYVDANNMNTYAPHSNRYCVYVHSRVPHSIKTKIDAAKVRPIYTRPTTAHIVTAIQDIVRRAREAAAQAA